MTKLPDGWTYEPLTKFIDSCSGNGKLIKGKQRSEFTKGFFPGFSASGQDIWTEKAEYFGEGVVVSAVGARCGKAFLAEGSWTAVANTHVLQIKKGADLDIRFLWYLCNDEKWWIRSGTAQPFVKVKDTLERLQLIPPLAEQHKIVEFLEDHLSRLDAALQDVKQAKIKAAQFRRSLLQASFIGYLSDETFTIGSEIPPSWRKTSLGNVLVPRKQKDIPSTFPNLPYIGMEHVAKDVGLINSFGSSADYRSAAPRVYEGDVLYGRLRPYLNKVAISPCEAFASGEFIVLPPNEEIIGKFLQLRLLSQDFVDFAGTLDTGDRPRVSWEQISRFELALPPIDEQMRIIASLDEHLSRLDASVSLADGMEKQSNGLRRSLLQAAFTGQLTKEVVNV